MASKPRLLGFLLVVASLASSLHAGVITLEEAYDRSLATDQSIAIAHAEASKARLEAKLAMTRLAPRLDSGLNATNRGQFSNRDDNSALGSSNGSSNSRSAGTARARMLKRSRIRIPRPSIPAPRR